MATTVFRNKNIVRPKKKGAAKRRRRLEQKRRLIALGVPEAELRKMTSRDILDLLKRPCKTAERYGGSAS